MKVHIMNLNLIAFEQVVNRVKAIETRLYDEKRKSINIGDAITFWCNNEKINVIVTDLLKYKRFEDLFTDNDLNLFGGTSLDDLMTIYKYYSKEDEAKYGVLGIKFKLLQK
ncbi:MAG: ASCH domain-containing protein [Candidatus Paceibacterota bacterium]|jgi:ASC-1-like (ASCH) protein